MVVAALLVSGSVIAGACIVRGGLASASPNKAGGTPTPTAGVPDFRVPSPSSSHRERPEPSVPGRDHNPASLAGRGGVPGKDFNPTKVNGPWLVPGLHFNPASKH